MSGRPARILIVDDEETIRRLLHQSLGKAGYQCQKAGNAEQALDKLKSDPAELVILDIKMPGKSGMELLPELKASHPDTVVIMVTATTDTSTAIQCLKDGAYDYITKPFNLDEVALSVDRALGKRRLELKNRDYHQHLEQKVAEQAERIRASFLNAITALVYALEAKDKYTSGHSQRVAKLSADIAQELGVPEGDITKIRLAGSIHDIGKIGVRESVLNKPSVLTDEEYRHVKDHCERGERILEPIVKDEAILGMVRHHHECHDGTGYPDGLSGEQIPLGARILAVADAFDAMTSERPYRRVMSTGKALAEIRRCSGTKFDPAIVAALFKIQGTEIGHTEV